MQSLCTSDLDLLLVATSSLFIWLLLVQSAAHIVAIMSRSSLLFLALLDSLSAQTVLPSVPCDELCLLLAVLLVGKDDLMDLPVDCPQQSCWDAVVSVS